MTSSTCGRHDRDSKHEPVNKSSTAVLLLRLQQTYRKLTPEKGRSLVIPVMKRVRILLQLLFTQFRIYTNDRLFDLLLLPVKVERVETWPIILTCKVLMLIFCVYTLCNIGGIIQCFGGTYLRKEALS